MSHSKYICMKCNSYDTPIFNEMIKHYLRTRPCKKKTDVILLSDDQLLVLSLIPYYYNNHCINIEETNHLEGSNLLSNNKNELFKIIENIQKNKLKICQFCNEDFNTIYDLRKHMIVKCFFNELNKRKNENDNIINNIEKSINCDNNVTNSNNCNITNNNNITNNITNNNNNITNNNNNVTNNLFFNIPIPFEDNWDLSEIPKAEKEGIIVSQYVFSRFLNEILKNDKNSNVIIDNDDGTDTGMVYINHKNQYIKMTKNDIMTNTMDKLYDQLYDLVDTNKDTLKVVKECSKDYIHNKYNKYIKDKETKKSLDEIILDTYNYNKNNAIKSYNDILVMNNNGIKTRPNSIINKKREVRNKTEMISCKAKIDMISKCRDEDIYYLYDSDGNTKG